jgi:hypothetical protein
MVVPSANKLKREIKDAVQKSVNDLFNGNENFYYIVLVTTEEAHSPILSAWSTEAFNKYNDINIKWSYADSPYFNYGKEYFDKINKLFSLRPLLNENTTENEWNEEYNLRLNAMENAMKELDDENIFERKDNKCRSNAARL